MTSKALMTAVIAASALCGTTVQAATVPFTEDFAVDNANWADSSFSPLAYNAAGGPDGSSFVSTTSDFLNANANDTLTIFRGHDSLDSSNDAFVGNYLAEGVTTLSVQVRHFAPEPLGFFARLASSANFPAAAVVEVVPVIPGVWTELTFDLSETNPFLFPEGVPYGSIFSSIGNIQIGVTAPASLAGSATPIPYQLDKVTITPEPASAGLFAVAGLAMLRRRK